MAVVFRSSCFIASISTIGLTGLKNPTMASKQASSVTARMLSIVSCIPQHIIDVRVVMTSSQTSRIASLTMSIMADVSQDKVVAARTRMMIVCDHAASLCKKLPQDSPGGGLAEAYRTVRPRLESIAAAVQETNFITVIA